MCCTLPPPYAGASNKNLKLLHFYFFWIGVINSCLLLLVVVIVEVLVVIISNRFISIKYSTQYGTQYSMNTVHHFVLSQVIQLRPFCDSQWNMFNLCFDLEYIHNLTTTHLYSSGAFVMYDLY